MKNTRDKTIVITGGSSGIGAAAARILTAQGAKVVITGRSEKTTKLASEIGCDHFLVDFSSFEDIKNFSNQLMQRYPSIHVLVNNVGGIFGERSMTEDGHEKTFQINHLGGFLLTQLLQKPLEETGGIVINTSSMAAMFAKIDLENLELEQKYSSMKAYANAKLMNILHACEITKRLHGVKAASFHPGVVYTGFAREGNLLTRLFYQTPIRKLLMISPENGADTMIWLINDHNWRSGSFYYKRKARKEPLYANKDNASKLWDISLKQIEKFL